MTLRRVQDRNRLIKTNFLKLDFFSKSVSLRFDDEDFRTCCGAVAGFTLILAIFLTFLYEVSEIYEGKVDKLTFLIKNQPEQQLGWRHINHIREAVFGLGIRSDILKSEGLLEIVHGVEKGGYQVQVSPLYNCTREVYQNMTGNTEKKIPPNLAIVCFNTTSGYLNKGFQPYISVNVCKNSTSGSSSSSIRKIDKHKNPPPIASLNQPRFHNKPKPTKPSTLLNHPNHKKSKKHSKCKTQEEIDKKLKRVDAWIFSLVDETDFTLPVTQLTSSFVGRHLTISNRFSKLYNMYLRIVEMYNKRGLIFRRRWYQRTVQFLRQYSQITSVSREEEILRMNLRLDQTQKLYIKKKFKSVLGILSKVGGLFQGLMLFMFALVYPFREVLYYRKLINTMFNVCVTTEDIEEAIGLQMYNTAGKEKFGKNDFSELNEGKGQGSKGGGNRVKLKRSRRPSLGDSGVNQLKIKKLYGEGLSGSKHVFGGCKNPKEQKENNNSKSSSGGNKTSSRFLKPQRSPKKRRTQGIFGSLIPLDSPKHLKRKSAKGQLDIFKETRNSPRNLKKNKFDRSLGKKTSLHESYMHNKSKIVNLDKIISKNQKRGFLGALADKNRQAQKEEIKERKGGFFSKLLQLKESMLGSKQSSKDSQSKHEVNLNKSNIIPRKNKNREAIGRGRRRQSDSSRNGRRLNISSSVDFNRSKYDCRLEPSEILADKVKKQKIQQKKNGKRYVKDNDEIKSRHSTNTIYLSSSLINKNDKIIGKRSVRRGSADSSSESRSHILHKSINLKSSRLSKKQSSSQIPHFESQEEEFDRKYNQRRKGKKKKNKVFLEAIADVEGESEPGINTLETSKRVNVDQNELLKLDKKTAGLFLGKKDKEDARKPSMAGGGDPDKTDPQNPTQTTKSTGNAKIQLKIPEINPSHYQAQNHLRPPGNKSISLNPNRKETPLDSPTQVNRNHKKGTNTPLSTERNMIEKTVIKISNGKNVKKSVSQTPVLKKRKLLNFDSMSPIPGGSHRPAIPTVSKFAAKKKPITGSHRDIKTKKNDIESMSKRSVSMQKKSIFQKFAALGIQSIDFL